MTPRNLLIIIALAAPSLASCAAPESVRTLSSTQRAAIEELALAWSADHALARAELAILIDIRRTTLRGRIHRELISTGCLTPDGDPDSAALAAAIADSTIDIALVREVRLGRMTEAHASAWLADYAVALHLSDNADGAATRTRLLTRLAPLESLDRDWDELRTALDARAERITVLAAEAAGASGSLADAFESRLSWRTIGAEAAGDAIVPAIDALFADPARRAAARELIARLLSEPVDSAE